MDWIKRFNEAIDYIEKNLTSEISYEKISTIACCSTYNFQRMFSYIADKQLSKYIRDRRLTYAAFDILDSKERIIDISVKYGYTSQDAFSRAFREFHGVLPSTARKETVNLKSCPKLSFKISIQGESTMNYQIENYPAFKVAGISNTVETSKAFEVVPKIWDTAWKNGTMNKFISLFKSTDYRPSGFLGISSGGEWGKSDKMEYIIGITNYVNVTDCEHVLPLSDMKEYCYPAATWAIFKANGELPDSIQKVYKQFYTEWLPNSGYLLADLPVIECYMQNNYQEVWIALEKDN